MFLSRKKAQFNCAFCVKYVVLIFVSIDASIKSFEEKGSQYLPSLSLPVLVV